MRTLEIACAAALAGCCSTGSVVAGAPYTIVDTGQIKCYDNRSEIASPRPGQPFYGQDGHFKAHPSSYTLSADGVTVHDNNTGLTWQRSPDTDGNGALNRSDKLTWSQSQARPAKLNAARFGGFNDWRLPSIKELYSLFDGRGIDPSGKQGSDTSGLVPFIDTKFFKFVYGDTTRGERIIDSQYTSSTKYVGRSARGFEKVFGVNFADGRIKGYDLQMPGGGQKDFFVLCVRGNPAYGKNDFRANTDETITDRATGLTWSKADSSKGLNWEQALAWVQARNTERYRGHDDWRLPSVKELQSIVDYTRSPDTTHSAAIDPLFECTSITNEAGQADYPFYWSGTSHPGFMGSGAAMYVAFGRAAGWLSDRGLLGGGRPGGFERNRPPGRGLPPRPGPQGTDAQRAHPGPGPGMRPDAGPPEGSGGSYRFADVHGAGAQRSDPKAGDARQFPHGRGPQGDVIRINNYVRLVRGEAGPNARE